MLLNPNKIEQSLGKIYMSSGNEYKVRCPFCLTKSMWINIAKVKYYCFTCNRHGSAFNIIKNSSEIVHDYAVFRTEVKKSVDFSLPFGYERVQTRTDFSIGWDYILRRGLNPSKLVFGKSADETDITFPIFEDGKIVYWQSRDVTGHFKQKTKNPNIKKDQFLFGLEEVYENDIIILVEGIFDRYHSGGVGVLGRTVSSIQLRKIYYKRPTLVIICFDADAHKQVEDTTMMLIRKGIFAVPMFLDSGDPAELGCKKLFEYINESVLNYYRSMSFRLSSLSLEYVEKLLNERCLIAQQYGSI